MSAHLCFHITSYSICSVFLLPGSALWTDRSGIMEEAALSCGECPLNANTQLLI